MLLRNARRSLAGWGAAAAALLCVASSAPAKAPTVTPVDAAGLKRAVAARKGKVVVVNFWATWCVPCVKEFPELVRLHNKHKGNGLDLLTVSMDTAQDVRPKVVPFLAKQGVTSGAFVQKGNADAFIQALDPNWQGEVPRTYIYGRNGKLVRVLSGEQSLAAFEAAVKPVLAKR
jgi:thiol-disulfide isomerase/thioredoxin